jgi:branched-subunit amino acid aminotransferase/4-amino-4-deoxychorismate lyase
MERLYAGLGAVGIAAPCPAGEMRERVRQLLSAVRMGPEAVARLRITVSSGPCRDARSRGGRPNVLATLEPWTQPAPECYSRGVAVAISAHVRAPHPLYQVKSTSQAWSAWSRREADPSRAFDVLQYNVRGELTEGTFTNVFVVDAEGAVHTPSPQEGCLPGVTRGVVCGLARELGLGCVEGGVTSEMVATATEMFLTSSLCGIVPVYQAGKLAIGERSPGPRTRRITDAYAARLDSERAAGLDWSRDQ